MIVDIETLPAPGFPPMHERFESLRSEAEDLGMVAFVDAGHSPASFDPAWANYPDAMVLRQLGASQMSQSAILMINGMVFGGVFVRHPKLTLVIAERLRLLEDYPERVVFSSDYAHNERDPPTAHYESVLVAWRQRCARRSWARIWQRGTPAMGDPLPTQPTTSGWN